MSLTAGRVGLRSLSPSDAKDWKAARARSVEFLSPWEATPPPGTPRPPRSFRAMARQLADQAREGRALPFVVTLDGRFVGQLTVNNIVRGSAQFASIGYWVDIRYAGRGVMPVAVALAIDHCFLERGLHRIEVAIRPENTASLRVVEKLGLREVGFAPRYLHIDGAWRDHRLFGVTVEDFPRGLLPRVEPPTDPPSGPSTDAARG